MINLSTGLPEGIDLELLAYDISDMLDRNEYPLDVCEADILPALGASSEQLSRTRGRQRMSETTTYPAPEEDETGAAYWERVQQLGLPFPWDADQSLPPGEIKITEEWASKDVLGLYWPYNEETVRRVASSVYGCTAWRRTVWTSVGPWEEVNE